MKVTVLDHQSTIINEFLRQIRDKNYQQNRQLFRQNLEKCGSILAYEISKELDYSSQAVPTSLGTKDIMLPKDELVLSCILRAALPFFQGHLNTFEFANSFFIGAYRQSESSDGVAINLDYIAGASTEGKTVIMIDPMLATGNSMVKSIRTILRNGKPKKIFVSALIATPHGIEQIQKEDFGDLEIQIFTCSVDEVLNEKFYIVPGLGDAGDLCFGEKL